MFPPENVSVAFTSPSESANAKAKAFLLYGRSIGISIFLIVLLGVLLRVYEAYARLSGILLAPGVIVLTANGSVITI